MALIIKSVKPEDSIYIGDNPRKDFIGARRMGMHVSRLMKGQHSKVRLGKDYEADYEIDSLKEIFEIIRGI